jgi:hypothetical protein
MRTIETRVQKTIDYLNTEIGRENWLHNISRGYTFYMNLFAAVQTATRLLKYEKIIEVYDAVNLVWEPEEKAA